MKSYTTIILSVAVLALLSWVGYSYLTNPRLKTSPDINIPVTSPEVSPSVSNTNSYTLSDIANHNNASSCWLAINSKVYDVTSYIPNHPGGDNILKGCGKDATSLFTSKEVHSGSQAQAELAKLLIGNLK